MPPKAGPARIILGVSGSIAAYKACEIVRGLARAGAQVRCVLSANARRFVSPLTLSALSKGPVCEDLFDPALWEMAHLSWASWAERVVVAPASAGLLSRLACGAADGPLEALLLAARCPVALAPAMDSEMWEHPATRANVRRLKGYGYAFWGPASGELASGKIGPGRMLEPSEIVRLALSPS